ncbi:hypothetical protein HPHPP11B_1424 [Helicobacter pylori Hp P-11b]|uniref:Uncharacterized protein n=1 Tax=Helicobacter pylori Hp P-11b TaxID=992106 RepID=I9YF32_HELPX|nr:hypothetical protein HPHPP11_0769 [Helicobacter pylori Hp P-11]EJC27320.1 hypothetical protein HPHPP11B_1424 [Helicobacter pylori Hp P-11b]
MLSKIHSIVRLKNLKGDGLKVFLMVAFKPFKMGYKQQLKSYNNP